MQRQIKPLRERLADPHGGGKPLFRRTIEEMSQNEQKAEAEECAKALRINVWQSTNQMFEVNDRLLALVHTQMHQHLKPCACEKPIPTAKDPAQIRCLKCGNTLALNRETALRQAIASVEESQTQGIYAAGIAFFLEDAGFDFDEIYECLLRQQESGVQHQ